MKKVVLLSNVGTSGPVLKARAVVTKKPPAPKPPPPPPPMDDLRILSLILPILRN